MAANEKELFALKPEWYRTRVARHGMRIVLVPLPEPLLWFGKRPLGAACLAAGALERAKTDGLAAEVIVLDQLDRASMTPEEIAARVIDHEPDIVGLGIYAWNQHVARPVARHIRESHLRPVVIAGGPWVTPDPLEFLGDNPAFDLVVQGEGTLVFAEIVMRLGRGASIEELAGVSGTAVRTGNGINLTPPLPCDLNALPFPHREGLLSSEDTILLRVRQGCPERCSYCNWAGGIVSRPIAAEKLAEDLCWAARHGIRQAFLIDSAINRSMHDLRIVAQAFESVAAEAAPPSFVCHLDYRLLDEARLEILQRCGFKEADIGLQTINKSVLQRIRRSVARQEFEQAVTKLRKFMNVTVDVILGLPGDDIDGVIETLDFAASLGLRLNLNLLYRIPGSELSKKPAEFGLTFNENGLPYVLESSTMPAEQIREAATYFVTSYERKNEWGDFSTWNTRFPRFPYNYLVPEAAYRVAHEKFGDPLPPPPVVAGQGQMGYHLRLGPQVDALFDPSAREPRELRIEDLIVRPLRIYPDRIAVSVESAGGKTAEVHIRSFPYQRGREEIATEDMYLVGGSDLSREGWSTLARAMDVAWPAPPRHSGEARPIISDPDHKPSSQVLVRISELLGQDMAATPFSMGAMALRLRHESHGEVIFQVEQMDRRGEIGLRRRTDDQPAFIKTEEFDLWYNEGQTMSVEDLINCVRSLAALLENARKC